MRIETIKKRSQFLAISQNNISYYSKSTLVLATKTPENENIKTNQNEPSVRVGYTITKKIGKAVFRNKCKRRYREIFKQLAPTLAKNNFDYVILARKEILNSDFNQIKSDVKFCLKGIGKLL